MSTEAQERAVEQAALRLRVARAEVRDALNLLHEDATMASRAA